MPKQDIAHPDILNLGEVDIAAFTSSRHSAELSLVGLSVSMFISSLTYPIPTKPASRLVLVTCIFINLTSTILSVITVVAPRSAIPLRCHRLSFHPTLQSFTFPASAVLALAGAIGLTALRLKE